MSKNNNLIEKKLLSRCRTFDKESKLVELLEKRYSATGDQKDFLVLKPTSDLSKNDRKKKQKSLLHEIKHYGTSNNKYNKSKTRNEFKLFIKSNLALQRRIGKELKKSGSVIESLKDYAKLLKFEDFLPMNALWQEYIRNLIQIKKPQEKLAPTDISTILSKLTSADLIGSFLTVSESRNSNVVGISGIVIWESQHNFILVVPRTDNWKNDIDIPRLDNRPVDIIWSHREQIGGIRIIAKKNTMFQMVTPVSLDTEQSMEFSIIGSRFNIKSYDRANKKFKNHSVEDII